MTKQKQVLVFGKPITREDFEGEAIVLEIGPEIGHLDDKGNRLKRCKVKFIDDGFVADRWVCPD